KSTPIISKKYTNDKRFLQLMLKLLMMNAILIKIKRGGLFMANYLFNSDRNFNDDIDDQSYYYVVTHNDLITKASHDLTARELKIMDFVISKIKPDDRDFNIINTSLYQLGKLFGYKRNGKNYSDLAKAIGTLRKKEV